MCEEVLLYFIVCRVIITKLTYLNINTEGSDGQKSVFSFFVLVLHVVFVLFFSEEKEITK